MAWRERNETEADLVNEDVVACWIERGGKRVVVPLGEVLYGVDFAVFKAGRTLDFFAEFKKRKIKYDTVILSLAKWQKMVNLSVSSGVASFFVVWFDGDGLYAFKVPSTGSVDFRIALEGNDRGQRGDKEPCVHIPISEFAFLVSEDDLINHYREATDNEDFDISSSATGN